MRAYRGYGTAVDIGKRSEQEASWAGVSCLLMGVIDARIESWRLATTSFVGRVTSSGPN
jgi:hypothetical protein